MSHEIVKNFTVKDGKITFKVASSNVYPRYYSEYQEACDEHNIMGLCTSIVWGCIQAASAVSPFGRFCEELRETSRKLKTASSWESDWKLSLGRDSGFEKLFAEKVGLPMFRRYFDLDGDTFEDKDPVIEYEKETAAIYAEAERKFAADGKIKIRCAIFSDLFPGYDVLVSDAGDTYLAKRENYNNKGVLDNSDDSAKKIRVPDGMTESQLFRFLEKGYGLNTMPQNALESIASDIEGMSYDVNAGFYFLMNNRESFAMTINY